MSLELRITSLEKKIKLLLDKHNNLKHDYKVLKQEIDLKTKDNVVLNNQLTALEQQFKSLQIANTLLGSDTDKRGAKLKINALIRDLDSCIAQLSV